MVIKNVELYKQGKLKTHTSNQVFQKLELKLIINANYTNL